MKTVRTHLKTKLLFILIVVLSFLAGRAFSQDISMIPQIYGDTSLVDINFEVRGDSMFFTIPPDSDILEVYSSYDDIDHTKENWWAETGKEEKFIVGDNGVTQMIHNTQFLFIRTVRGMTSFFFIKGGEGEYAARDIVMNGEMVALTFRGEILRGEYIQPEYLQSLEWRWNDKWQALFASR
jgi:hypothetical protein